MKLKDVELLFLGNSSFLIKGAGTIYIDPYKLPFGCKKADFIFLTHSHYDHCSLEDLKKVVRPGTVIVSTPDCQSRLTRFDVPVQIELIEPGEEFVFGTFKVLAYPAYNIGKSYHLKNENLVGYLFKFRNSLIYHSGDTDVIPEMRKLSGYRGKGKTFVALLSVGGRFTMSFEEAVLACKMINPDIAIPMHSGGDRGDETFFEEFLEICGEEGINAKILDLKS